MSGFRHFHVRHFACLPPGAPPQLRVAWRVLAPLAGALWGPVIASIWWAWRPPAMEVLGRAAVTVTIVAALCWVAGILSADGRRELIRLSGDLHARIPEEELPPRLAASGR